MTERTFLRHDRWNRQRQGGPVKRTRWHGLVRYAVLRAMKGNLTLAGLDPSIRHVQTERGTENGPEQS